MPLDIIRNDITKVRADAIVNTANPRAAIGEGTDHAIYEAAGKEKLLAERAKLGDIHPGSAAYTPAFALDAKYIIHTVGPAWRGGGYHERETAASCYRKSLEIADRLGCETVAFPLISTGTYGFPKDEALRIAVDEISSFLFTHDMTVYLVVYDRESFVISGKAFAGVKSYIAEHEIKPGSLTGSGNRVRRLADSGPGRKNRCFADSDPGSNFLHTEITSTSTDQPEDRPVSYTASPDHRDEIHILYSDTTEEYSTDTEAGEEYSKDIEVAESLLFAEEAGAPAAQSELSSMGLTEEAEPPTVRSELSSMGLAGEAGAPEAPEIQSKSSYRELTIDDIVRMKEETFQQVLFRIIDRKGMTDPEVYKKSNIDRKLFSKIRSDVNYTPSKKTVMALIIGLELNVDEAQDLLNRAGYSFSPADLSDLTVKACIEQHMYNIHLVNCYLFDLGQKTLGA